MRALVGHAVALQQCPALQFGKRKVRRQQPSQEAGAPQFHLEGLAAMLSGESEPKATAAILSGESEPVITAVIVFSEFESIGSPDIPHSSS